jgi:hypothetical protein
MLVIPSLGLFSLLMFLPDGGRFRYIVYILTRVTLAAALGSRLSLQPVPGNMSQSPGCANRTGAIWGCRAVMWLQPAE